MNNKTIQNLLFIIISVFSLNTFAAGWNASTHDLVAGDFNADGKDDMLYVAKDPSSKSGIVLADTETGELTVLHQEWDSNHLGLSWHSGTYAIHVGDFNGDGRADVFMDHSTNGINYILHTDASGELQTKSQTIANTAIGLNWGTSRLVFGDFNGDTRTDVYLQPKDAQTSSRIVFADAAGKFTTIGDTWGNEHLGFQWSQNDAMVYAGDFDGNNQDDLLIQAKPDWVMIPYSDLVIPVQRFEDQANGIVAANSLGKFSAGVSLDFWASEFLNINWSPDKYQVIVGDFDNDGQDDIFVQSLQSGQSSFILLATATGQFSTLVQANQTLDSSFSAASYTAIVGSFTENGPDQLYLQAVAQNGTNYVTNPGNSTTPIGTRTTHNPENAEDAPITGEVVGLTPGEFRVDESGAAIYNIPINTPMGRAGVTPQVALSYSSSNLAEGPVGVGWSISGLSSITRCPQTPIYDAGNIQAVQYHSSDKFCLGGQRLILKSGTYGAPNSTYRTEIDNFSVITARLGTTANGPKYFEVTNKSGETHYFGDSSSVSSYFTNHADAFVEPSGYAAGVLARSWMLKVTKDRKDNYILFNYAKDTAKGTLYIDSIKYSGNLNTGDSTFAEIDFVYQAYNKGFKGYMSGAPVFHDMLLSRVDTKVDGDTYRSYFTEYENSAFIEERTLLKSVQECNDANKTTCFPKTLFNWQRPTLATGTTQQVCETEPGSPNFCFDVPTTTTYQAYPDVDSSLATGTANRESTEVFDINGDGYSDLIYVSGTSWVVKLGPNFGSAISLSSVGDGKKEYALNIDYNGDGVRDLLVADSATSNWHAIYYKPTVTTYEMCPPREPCEDINITTSKGIQDLGVVATGLDGLTQVMDVNGDGLEDIVFSSSTSIRAHINNGDGTFVANQLISNLGSTTSSIGFNNGSLSQTANLKSSSAIDINGDGRSDLITKVTTRTGGCYNSVGQLMNFVSSRAECEGDVFGTWNASTTTNYKLYRSSGVVTAPSLTLVQSLGSASSISNLRIADLNGDGLSDLLYVVSNRWYYRLSNGKQLLNARDTGLTTTANNKYLEQFVDLNGDGRADILHATSTSNWDVYFSRPTMDAAWITFEKRGSQSFNSNATIRFGDTNGDGKLNMLTATDGTWKEYSNRKNIKEYVINNITGGNGVATNIVYKPMTNQSVYVFQASDDNINSDTFSPVSGMQVVNTVTVDSNVGSTVKQIHQYGGLLVHKKGRGSLGFEMVRITDLNGIVTETHYNQNHDAVNFAKARMPEYTEQRLNGELISSVVNTLGIKTSSQGGVFPYIKISEETSYIYGTDNVSTKINTVESTNEYDSWGNVTKNTSVATDSVTSETIETITNNDFGVSIEQQYGLLKATTVQKKRTGDVDYTSRDTAFTYYSDLLLHKSVISPSDDKTKLTTTYLYNSYGNKISVEVTGFSTETGVNQTRVTTDNYDARGRYINYKQNSLGERVTYKYNSATAGVASGVITNVTKTDSNNLSTISYFNNLGQLIKIDHPDSRLTKITSKLCDANCVATNSYYKVLKTENGMPTKEVFFDRWNRQVGSRVIGFDGAWSLTQMSYDSLGREFRAYEPESTTYFTETHYDDLGRINKVIKPNGGVITQQVYGLEGRTTNELLNVSKTFSNGFGEAAYTLDAAGNKVMFTYDAFGNMLESKTTAAGTDKDSIITTTFDRWGRKKYTQDPVKGMWSYKYNAFGELYSEETANGNTFTFTYDLAGRKVRSYEEEQGTLCWNYGSSAQANIKAVGQLISTAKYEGLDEACNTTKTASIKKQFTFDALGRPKNVETITGGITYIQSQTYDSYSRPAVTTYPTGISDFAVKNVYNSYGYLSEQRNNDSSNDLFKRIVSMNDRGQVEQVTLGNGVTSSQSYRADNGWLSDIDVQKGAEWLNGVVVTYDAIGNVKTRESAYAATGLSGSHFTETYNYDDLNRLENRTIAVALGGVNLPSGFLPTQSYELDNLGNFKFKSGVGYYKYDATKVHKLLGVYDNADFSGTEKYTFNYDSNGNVKTDGKRTFIYSSTDKPLSIIKTGVSSAMKYGVSDELYFKADTYIEAGKSVTYNTTYLGVYEKVVRSGGEGDLIEHKYNVGDIIVTQRSNDTSDTYYLHKDHQGSIVATTNHTGHVVSQAIYDPFGKRTAVYLDSDFTNYEFSEPTDRGYTGHKHIADLDIVHMGGRIYDSTLGRFLQADPFVQAPLYSQSYNRYSYVQNNPMTMTDPSGYFSLFSVFKLVASHFLSKSVKKIVRNIFRALGPTASKWLVNIGSIACGPLYASCVAVGNYNVARAFGANKSGALKAGAISGVTAHIHGQPTSVNVIQVAADIIDPDVGRIVNFLYNGYDNSSATNTTLALAHEVKNHYVSKEVERFANKNGLSLGEFNALLTLNSFIGNELAGSRYDLKKNEVSGFTTRRNGKLFGDFSRVFGVIWDINDTILGYQGLLDASGYDYLNGPKAGQAIAGCHSLGTLTCNNLVAKGYAPSAQLNSLPFGNIAVGANASRTNLGEFDIVNGMFLGFILNPLANKTDCHGDICHGWNENYRRYPRP